MSGTARPSAPSTSSLPERTLPVWRVSLFGFEGTDTYVTPEEPRFWQHLVSTGALPDWLVFQTISGAKVAVREDSVQQVEVVREVGVDLDAEPSKPNPKGAKKKSNKPSTSESFD